MLLKFAADLPLRRMSQKEIRRDRPGSNDAMPAPRRQGGLTLLELLLLLGMIGVLAMTAVPPLMDTLSRMNTTAAARSLTSALNLARSEAVKRGRNVMVCPSTSGTDCAAGSWSSGWIVFVDANGDADGATGSVDAGDTIIRVFDQRSGLAIAVAPATNLLTYDNRGYGRMGALRTVTICPQDGNDANARQVEITVSGRSRIISTGVSCP
jgi:type IV fimbrial biogenesis protein FimT